MFGRIRDIFISMGNRRNFIHKLAIGSVGLSSIPRLGKFTPPRLYDSWDDIKNLFAVSKAELLNLNSGSAGSMPYPVLEKYIAETEKFNTHPLYNEKASRMDEYNAALGQLADFMNCPAENLALTKNTTESLNTIIWGFPLEKTDNVIIADADYAYVQTGFANRSAKEGFTVKRLTYRPARLSDEEIVHEYIKAIDDNTKLIVVSMITPREGQLLPTKQLIEAAHARDVEVLVDGAHTLGQCIVDIHDLNCDYFAGCLHKWMNGPHGMGVLFVKEAHIEKLDPPMFPFPEQHDQRMAKYTYSGTIGFQKIFTLDALMEFNLKIDLSKKIERFAYLTEYWQNKLAQIPGIEIVTDPARCISLGGFNLDGRATGAFLKSMREKHKVNIKKTGYPEQSFYRVSTNIFIDENDLDKFCDAVEMLSQEQ